MTDKLHCPFCGAELLGTLCAKYCPNEDCMCYSETISTSIWQALIDSKKAQEALDWLNEYLTEDKVEENVAVSCQYLKAKITSITKQENE